MILELIQLYRSRCLLSFRGSKAFKGPIKGFGLRDLGKDDKIWH